LQRAAEDFPNRIACHACDRVLTYADIWRDSLKIAAILQADGIKPGDRVGLLLPNMPEYLSALNGIWLAGGVAVAISPLLVEEEVAKLLEATDCRTVISLDLLAPPLLGNDFDTARTLLVTLRDQLPVWQRWGYSLTGIRRTGRWWLTPNSELRWLHAEMERFEGDFTPVMPESLDLPAYILPTGGTTGHPKAVTLSHRNLVSNAWQQWHWTTLPRGEDTFMAVLPFFHSYGLSATLMTGVTMAATLIMHHRFHLRTVLKLIEKHKPTVFHAVPAMLAAMNERLKTKPADLESIRWVISGGAPMPPEVATEFAAHCGGAVVVEGYGLSEASPVTHVGPLDGTNKLGTIGFPLPDTEAQIMDIETGSKPMAVGEVGELWVKGPQVMLGYWNAPAETAKVMHKGWLKTGDLAKRDDAGFYQIVDRMKDLIITSGFNVYPGEVEEVLKLHPDVADVAIVGRPCSKRGEVVTALVVMQKNAKFNVSNLEHYCQKHLAHHKRPKVFEEVQGALPRNFLGKVLRRHLRENTPPAPASNVEKLEEELMDANQANPAGER
jgi:long-chain acyl-CoA synthetase